jgi:hypothetical protein
MPRKSLTHLHFLVGLAATEPSQKAKMVSTFKEKEEEQRAGHIERSNIDHERRKRGSEKDLFPGFNRA